jgi:Fe-S cluster biosynthesis and repair protein YggX
MTRTVTCRKFGEDLEGLDAPPFPGPKGQEVFEQVSRKAWEAWLEHQTRLINEKHLNMMEPEARKYLATQRELFLSGGEAEEAEGYVPEG